MEAHVLAGLAVGFGYAGFLAGLAAHRWSKAPLRPKPDRAARDLDRLADALVEQAVGKWVAERMGCPCMHEQLCDAALGILEAPTTPAGTFTREQKRDAGRTLLHLPVHVGRRWREFRRQEETR